MKEMYEVIKALLPAAVVMLTVYFMMRAFLIGQDKDRKMAIWQDKRSVTLPLRLQAYERLAIFLERLSPESMLMRVDMQGMSSGELQSALLTMIRNEFDHNVSQQIYVSQDAWDTVKKVRSYTVRQIQAVASMVSSDQPAMAFSTQFLKMTVESDTSPSEKALAMLKEEVSTLFA